MLYYVTCTHTDKFQDSVCIDLVAHIYLFCNLFAVWRIIFVIVIGFLCFVAYSSHHWKMVLYDINIKACIR